MIILNTNVISEMMRSAPAASVISWLDQQEAIELHLTTITIAEISYRLSALPEGARRKSLEMAFNNVIKDAFKHRILPFDEAAAYSYGKLMGHKKALGKPMSILDGQIAAITSVHEAVLATRNVRDFADCGIDLFNPF